MAEFYKRNNITSVSYTHLTKDDSLDNLVLVKKNINIELSDTYPLDISIQNKMFSFWKELKEQGFISSNKFYRLIRKDALTIEELAGFINRQLVETSQAAKTTADILKKLYPSTEIISVSYTHLDVYKRQEYDNAEKRDIDFRVSSFNEEREVYEQILNEDILLLDYLKSVYDWMILSEILKSKDVYKRQRQDFID